MAQAIGIHLDRVQIVNFPPDLDKPIINVNLLRFKQIAQYQDDRSTGLSGRDAYMQHYVPAFSKVVANLFGPDAEIHPTFIGEAHASLVSGDYVDGEWDMIALVRYPNFTMFKQVVESAAYGESVQPHRLAALENWRVYVTTEIEQ